MIYIIGVDIGGTKISVCIANDKGKIILSERTLTAPLKTAKAGTDAIIKLIEKVLKKSKIKRHLIKAIGISSPGPLDSKKGILLTPPNLPGWHNQKITEPLQKAFKLPTFLSNDANAAVLAEYYFGGAKKTSNMIYLTMSTGIGGGIILRDRLIVGKTETAGEVGHMILDLKGPKCACGMSGCFEAFCGGKSMALRAQALIKKNKIKTKMIQHAGSINKIDAASLVEAVKEKDPFALKFWEEFIERSAQAIGILIMAFNPEVIVLGTIVIHAKNLFLTPFRKKLKKYCWQPPREICKIVPSKLEVNISELSGVALAIYELQKLK